MPAGQTKLYTLFSKKGFNITHFKSKSHSECGECCQWQVIFCSSKINVKLQGIFCIETPFLFLISATGLNMWVSLFSTGIICTVYTTLVRSFFFSCHQTSTALCLGTLTTRGFYSNTNVHSEMYMSIVSSKYIILDLDDFITAGLLDLQPVLQQDIAVHVCLT